MRSPPKRKKGPPLDFASIAASADLPAIVASEGIRVQNGKCFCPFHTNDQTEALSIYQKAGRWHFKCHSCGESGDAIDWRAKRDGISKVDAAKVLNGGMSTPATLASSKVTLEPRPSDSLVWLNPSWQKMALGMIEFANGLLCEPGKMGYPVDFGTPYFDWLRRRGLSDSTVRRFRLGFLPSGGFTSSYLCPIGKQTWAKLERGIVFPWASTGYSYGDTDSLEKPNSALHLVGVNVRLLAKKPADPLPPELDKCRCLKGSTRGFPYPEAIPPGRQDRPCLIVEGEIDALIAWQEVRHLVNVMTVGGAKQKPSKAVLESLEGCPCILLALDRDDAGREGVRLWQETVGLNRTRRPLIPYGFKDIGEMKMAGVSIEAWLSGELERLGLSSPLDRVQEAPVMACSASSSPVDPPSSDDPLDASEINWSDIY